MKRSYLNIAAIGTSVFILFGFTACNSRNTAKNDANAVRNEMVYPLTVDNPYVIHNNTIYISFTKIELTDSATILSVHADFIPHSWICISGHSTLTTDTKVVLPVLSGDGIQLDSLFYMPASGEADFKLIFGPMPKDAGYFDFSEGDFEGAFKLFGVYFTSEKPVLEVPEKVDMVKYGSDKASKKAMKKYLKQHPAPENTDSIVLIFKDAPENESVNLISGGSVATLHYVRKGPVFYIDKDTLLQNFTPKTGDSDTLVIPSHDGTAELLYQYRFLSEERYLLRGGDTVTFTYNWCGHSYANSSFGEVQTAIYNLFTESPVYYHNYGLPITYILKGGLFSHIYEMAAQGKMDNLKPSFRAMVMADYVNLGTLNDLFGRYLAEIASKLEKYGPFMTGKERMYYGNTYSNISKDLTGNDSLSYKSSYNGSSISSDFSKFNDSLIFSPYYQVGLTDFADILASDFGASVVLDSLMSDPSIPSFTGRQVARMLLDDLIHPQKVSGSTLSMREINSYVRKCIEYTGDSSLNGLMMDESVMTNVLKNGYSNDYRLNDLNGKNMNYSELIRSCAGKVVVVDFWGSWCVPCRASMPAAKKVREHFRGKDVVFIYLSINDTDKNWKNAVKACETDYLGRNYIVMNSSTAKVHKELAIQSVPRIVIYDKKGNVAVLNAPRSEDPKLITTIDGLLR